MLTTLLLETHTPPVVGEGARHQVAIAGRVTDAQTGSSLGGVRVEITAAPPAFVSLMASKAKQSGERWDKLQQRPDRTRTADDGHFHFLDLPEGKYTLAASLPDCGSRYGSAETKNIAVKRDADGTITMATADITLPSTTLKGQITRKGAAPGAGVVMAEVRLKGSGEYTFSDADGKYVLNGVQAGNRTVLVSLKGYQPASQTVKLPQPGTVETADFRLAPCAA